MNKIRQLTEKDGTKLSRIAEALEVTRGGLNWKIDNDSFRPDEKPVVAGVMRRKLEEVFPKRPTTPSRVYIERCKFMKDSPSSPKWDGVWTLTSK